MADVQQQAMDPEKRAVSSDDESLHHKSAHNGPIHNEGTKVDRIEGEESAKVNTTKDDGAPSKWTFRRIIAVISLCLVYVGAQEILYFTGGALTYIGFSINTTFPNWLLTANTLAVTAVCPFVGYLTDLLGRRWICILGSLLLVIGSIVLGVTKSLGSAVTGEAIAGVGAGICELTALAGVAEITPVRWRGVTLSVVTFSIVPFMPYLIYIQQLQEHSSWRWVFCIAGVWNFIGLAGIVLCYKPPPRHNVDGMSRMQIIRQIDFVGAFLSIGGVTLFLVGLQAGGYQYPWTTGKVLGPLIVGILMLFFAFPAWEIFGTSKPMVPKQIFEGQRVVALALVIVFIAGMNFYSVLGFFPLILEYFYDTTPMQIGVRGLCYPIAILAGACIVSFAMSYTRGHVREMFFIAATLMTAFGGALAAATPFNPGLAIAMATLDSFGIGAIIVPSLTLALYACPDAYIGTTAALSLTTRFLGGSIGTAIYYNIFNSKIKTNLPAYVGKAALQAGLPQDSAVQFVQAIAAPANNAALLQKVPGVTPEIVQAGVLAAHWAFADSLKYVWYATIPFGIICMICCAFLPNIRKFMTNRLAVDIH